MSKPDLHQPYSVQAFRSSESAIVYLPHNEQIAIKRLKRFKDHRYNQYTPNDRQDCQLEALRWNRKFTPQIHQGLALLCKKHTSSEKHASEEKPPKFVCIGPILKKPAKTDLFPDKDYVMVMKRLPDAWRLDNIIASSEKKLEHLEDDILKLTNHISYLYKYKLKPLSKKESTRWGSVVQIRRKLTENLRLLKKALREQDMSYEPYDLLRIQLRKILLRKSFTDNFQERLKAGFIRRCHGDLKAPNIWIAPSDKRKGEQTKDYIWLLDAIDFNPSYCNIDVLSDFALLAVDIQARTGSKDLVDQMIKYYLEQTKQEDETAQAVLAYYLVEKAIVSAAVSIKFDKKRDLGEVYLRIAESRLHELKQYILDKPRLLIGSLSN